MLSDGNPLETPLTIEELEGIFAPLALFGTLLLAVSGGADSLALMHLVHDWAVTRKSKIKLHIATVDHGLRVEAAEECAFVAAEAARLGLVHTILKWHHSDSVDRNLQAQAREARYRLLADHAREIDCSHIVLAHHMDDQAETVFIRLIRGSGVSGLAAMVQEKQLDDIVVHRPLLGVPKSRLVASLKVRGRRWIEDPSNQNEDFLRVRVRHLLPILAQEGCDASRLAKTARRMARAEQALNAMTGEIFSRFFNPEPGRALSVCLKRFVNQSDEIRLRLLRASLHYVVASDYPPREEGLLGLDEALCQMMAVDQLQRRSLKRTLGGCCFDLRGGRLWIYREPGRDAKEIPIDPSGMVDWYNLYQVELLEALEGVTLRPLGEMGRLVLATEGHIHAHLAGDNTMCPKGLIEACPALWRDTIPIAVVDWPEIARKSGARVDFRGKDPRFTFNQAFG